MSGQQVLLKKEKVNEIIPLVNQYQVIGIASLQKVRASQLQNFKKNLH